MTRPDFCAELQALLNAVHDLRIEGGEPKQGAFKTALDRARAALSAAPQQPSDQEIRDLAEFDCNYSYFDCNDADGNKWLAWECDDRGLIKFARTLLTRYGAQAAPVAFPCSIRKCSNCGSKELEWQASIQYKHAGIEADRPTPVFALGCVECSETLRTVDADDVAAWMNGSTHGQAVPVAVAERLPGPGDCAPWPDGIPSEPWCWQGRFVWQRQAWEWIQASMSHLTSESFDGNKFTHWLPHYALPLPEAKP